MLKNHEQNAIAYLLSRQDLALSILGQMAGRHTYLPWGDVEDVGNETDHRMCVRQMADVALETVTYRSEGGSADPSAWKTC